MSKRKYIEGRNKDKDLSPLLLMFRCVQFTFVFLIIYLLISLGVTAFLYTTINPTKNIHVFALVSCCVSSLLSGFFISKVNGQKWLISGAFLGLLTIFVIFLIGLLFPNDEKTYVQYALIPVFCVLGAFFGKRHIKQRKHKKHR